MYLPQTEQKFASRKMGQSIIVSTVFFVSFLVWVDSASIVTIKQGSLRGFVSESWNGTKYNVYYGIPFAKPPVGRLRFQPPREAEPWSGTFDATVEGARCVQMLHSTSNVAGSEDCLNLNVYSPADAKPGDNIPVMMLIYGGIFKKRSNYEDRPNYLMNRRIIIVVPNYRLGVLGFLTTGDSVISGNMALKDQVMAMKWIKNNIRAFGGDPNQVTLFGHSSGGICVHLHTLSPSSVGLFKRVVIESGIGLGTNAFFDREVARSVGREFAARVGCKRKTSEEILQCLLAVDADRFPVVQEQMFIWDKEPDAAFRPTSEVESAKEPFLTAIPPLSSHPKTDFEWMIGCTTGEGAFKAARLLSGDGELVRIMDAKYKRLYPVSMQYLWTSKLKYKEEMSKKIRKHFFGNKHMNETTAIQIMEMYSEALFTQPLYNGIRKFSGTKYVYLFDHWLNHTEQNIDGYYPIRLGISHADDLHLIFYYDTSAPNLTDEDFEVGDEMITRLINFFYSGNPNRPFPINERLYGLWHPTNSKSSEIDYLRIKIGGSMEKGFGEKSNKFWKNIPIMSKYFKY